MALSGTLQDLGVVDLVQFPAPGSKTGELIVAGIEEEARLYYNKGRLQHITCGEYVGLDALVELVSWAEGEFEFRQGTIIDTISVEMELHTFLTRALEERETRSSLQQESAGQSDIFDALSSVAEKLEYVESAALCAYDGQLVCSWYREQPDATLDKMIEEVISIISSHPREGIQKVYLTDTKGTSIASVVNDNLILLLSTNDLSSLGMVSIASSKIISAVLEVYETT